MFIGLLLAPKLAGVLCHVIERQIYIYERQCKLLWILRKRYKDKGVNLLFNKESWILKFVKKNHKITNIF